jgi:hypothetical protein
LFTCSSFLFLPYILPMFAHCSVVKWGVQYLAIGPTVTATVRGLPLSLCAWLLAPPFGPVGEGENGNYKLQVACHHSLEVRTPSGMRGLRE